LQRRDTERLVAIHGQFPIDHQFFLVDFDLGQHQFELLRRNTAAENGTVGDRNHGFTTLIANVNMRQIVLAIVPKEHQHQNSVEHAYGRHSQILCVC